MSLVEFELALIAVLLLAILLKPTTDPHRMQQIADRLGEISKQLDGLLGGGDSEAIRQPAGERDQQY